MYKVRHVYFVMYSPLCQQAEMIYGKCLFGNEYVQLDYKIVIYKEMPYNLFDCEYSGKCLFGNLIMFNCGYQGAMLLILVLLGVAVYTVTDVSVNAKGFIAALVAVWSTALQQYVSNSLLNP